MKIKDSKWRASRKKLPKTLSESFTAECGHTFSYRVSLKNLAGLDASDENWGKVEKIVEKEKALRTLTECPDCMAAVNLDSCRVNERILFRFLDVDPISPLKGTNRQLAYAENVRQSFIVEPLRVLQRSLMLGEKYPIFKFFLKSIENLGETHGIQLLSESKSHVFSQDLENLQKDFQRAQVDHIFSPIKDPQLVLAFWLVSRKFWDEELKHIELQDRSKTWIARSNRRSNVFHLHTIASAQRYIEHNWSDCSAALLVAKITAWENRQQAEMAYKFLTTEDGLDSNISILMKTLEKNACSSWNEVFDMAAVWKTLS